MKILSYYAMGTPDMDALRKIWRWYPAWRDQGHDPQVLNEYHAMQHPFYAQMSTAINWLPESNQASFLRWIAAAQVLGKNYGVLCHFDRLPDPDKYLDLKPPEMPARKGKPPKESPLPPISVYGDHYFMAGSGKAFGATAELLIEQINGSSKDVVVTDIMVLGGLSWGENYWRLLRYEGLMVDNTPMQPIRWPTEPQPMVRT